MNGYDWEGCKVDYRAGQVSIRQLAAKHGIPESTVRSKAKAEGWQRDLTDDVRQATREKLSRTSRSEVAHDDEQEIIEQASSDAAEMVMDHRRAIARWRRISQRLADTLERIEVTEDNHSEFARSLNSGIDALGKAVRLERQSFGLDSDEKPEEERNSLQVLVAQINANPHCTLRPQEQ
ncbi:MAG: helix-turn-helix domain-containing protein [Pseudomonadota bacterium]